MTVQNILQTDSGQQAVNKINSNFSELSSRGGGNTAPKYINNPFPVYKDTVKILSLGNSFTYFPTKYLGDLLTAAGADNSKFKFNIAYTQGRNLQDWLTAVKNNTTPNDFKSVGGGTLSVSGSGNGTCDLLSRDWDIVILQAKSTEAKTWSTYEPYLTELVHAIRRYCTNQKVCIAWQQTWSCTMSSISASDSEWYAINSNLLNVMSANGIDVVIPTGTAMQNARHSSLNTAHLLMEDSTGHPLAGVARYIGACTWYQALFAPLIGLHGVVGNTATKAVSADSESSGAYSDEAADVTNDNKELCQLAAAAACTDMFNITSIE